MQIITTTKGPLDAAALRCQRGEIDNEDEKTTWVEYWQGGLDHEHRFEHAGPILADGSRRCLDCPAELVHRSVDMTLKKLPTFATGEAASLG